MDRTNLLTARALSLLRIVAGLMFIEHGTQKLFGFPAAPPHGLPHAFSLLWFAGLLEAAGGLLVALGLFARPVAFILSGEMAVAYWTAHAPRSFFPVLSGGDAAVLYCFIFLLVAAAGPGIWSLDAARGREAGPATP